MTVHTTWFGPDESPLLGTVHIPEGGAARGAVVLCPPLGMEQIVAYRGMMLLAQRLCAAGLVVVRFDYRGTGDSAGAQEHPNAVEHWLESIVTAVDYARGLGTDHVAVGGLRAGALLAATAAERCAPLAAVALWDPVASGRSYLRQQMATYRMSVGAEDDPDLVSIPSLVLAKDAAAEFASLSLSTLDLQRSARRVLVAARADKQADRVLRSMVELSDATELILHHQDRFLEVSSQFVRMPVSDIKAIGRWVADSFPRDQQRVRMPLIRDVAELGRTPDGCLVTEALRRVGPDHLFAIVTSTAVTPTRSLVLCSASKEHRVGPARLFVELARDLAGLGIEVIRFDRRGVGESGVVRDGEMTPVYSSESAADAHNVLLAARAAPRGVVVAGLCSGSWMAMTAARRLGLGSVVLLSPVIWSLHTREGKIAAAQQAIDSNQSPDAGTPFRRRVKSVLQRHLPYALWRLLGRLGITQVPEVALRPLLHRGVEVTIVLPPADDAWFIAQRGREGLQRLRRSGLAPQLVSGTEGDHSLLHRNMRHVARDIIRQVAVRGESSAAAAQQ